MGLMRKNHYNKNPNPYEGTLIVVQHVKLLPAMSAPHVRGLIRVWMLLSQINVLGPITHVGNKDGIPHSWIQPS